MCGIFCCLWNTTKKHNFTNQLNNSLKYIKHRGPDNQKLINGNGWALGHTRLSIIDTSKRAHQPFTDKEKRYYLSFNGEIYNYLELRKQLVDEGFNLNTSSDTEVLFYLLKFKGIDKTLKLIRGMFSFIFYDKVKSILHGARDHFGQKPFHYTLKDNFFAVCSEVKPLIKLHSKIELDLMSCRTYLCSNGIIEKDRTFFKDTFTLPAGHMIKFEKGKVKIKKYFDVIDLHDNNDHQLKSSISSNIEKLNHFLEKAVKNHMLSDVPIGILLSGGIDSTLIYKYALKLNPSLSAYTKISPGIEEIPEEIVPKIGKIFSKEINFNYEKKENYLLETLKFVKHTATPSRWGGGPAMSRLCKEAYSQGVKVLLGGDGVDEACAGYNSHKTLIDNFDNDFFKLHSLVDLDQSSQFFQLSEMESFLENRKNERKRIYDALVEIRNKKEKFSRAILFQDVGTFLQTCNLPHSDAYSMMVSTELRNPFLDINLMKFILNLPIKHRLKRHNSGHFNKFIFRKLSEKFFGNFINLPKEGTRNFSMYISNPSFWNFEKFSIRDEFKLNNSIEGKSLFKYLNLEFLYRTVINNEEDFLFQIMTKKGIECNYL